jgi:hypothetical protein
VLDLGRQAVYLESARAGRHQSIEPHDERITLVLFRGASRCALGVEPKVRARVRKSRQQEAAGAADAGLMQIEWSEGEMLKLGGVSTEAEEGAREGRGARIDIGKRCDRERAVGMGSGAGWPGTGRGEPCGGFELCASRFMPQ